MFWALRSQIKIVYLTAACATAFSGTILSAATSRGEAGPAPREALGDLSAPRPLNDPELAKLGIDFESEDVRANAISQAKAYADYRARAGARRRDNAFVEACEPKTQNIYCGMEQARFASATAGRSPRAKASRVSKRKADSTRRTLMAALEKGDFGAVNARAPAQVASAIASYDDLSQAKPAIDAVKKRTDCDVAQAASALGAKAEEFFPSKEAIQASLEMYDRAAACGAPTTAARARYRLGLIAIWQNRCADAEALFQTLEGAQAGFPYRARARFWRLQCAKKSGNDAVAEAMRAALMRDHPLTFHNLAVNGGDPDFFKRVPQEPARAAMRSKSRPEHNEMIRAIEALIAVGRAPLASECAETFSGRIESLEPEARLWIAMLLNRAHQGLAEFRVLSQLLSERPGWINRETMRLMYPVWYMDELKARASDVDPLLVLSLIRQESGFNERAQSRVGARGLMQLMPATARLTARTSKRKLFDPATNIAVGVKFLDRSLERFSGDVELTLAGYNAGAERAAAWAKRYPTADRVLFLDLIPFRETREYVSSILRNYWWYVALGDAQDVAEKTPGDAPAPARKLASILSASATPTAASAEASERH